MAHQPADETMKRMLNAKMRDIERLHAAPTKFKVGDKVRLTDAGVDFYQNVHDRTGDAFRHTYTITDSAGSLIVSYCFGNEDYWFDEEWLVPA